MDGKVDGGGKVDECEDGRVVDGQIGTVWRGDRKGV